MHDEIYAALQMLLELKESVGEGLNKLEDTVRRESDD